MPWLQSQLIISQTQSPIIELLFENLGAVAITLGDAGDEPLMEPGPGEMPLWQAVKVTGLFEGDTDSDQLRSDINQSLSSDVSRNLVLERIEDQDWERTWLERFKPMCFGKRLWICPSSHTVDAKDAVVIDLDPGLAFGTGTHPTTSLCLEWLDSANLTGKTVIDFGCGSGILAIAALKLGAAKAIAIDHDPQALLATEENAKLNGVEDRLETFDSTNYPTNSGDIVLANILANILISLSDQISPLVKPKGELILSGILESQWQEVAKCYQDTLDFNPPKNDAGWMLLTAVKH